MRVKTVEMPQVKDADRWKGKLTNLPDLLCSLVTHHIYTMNHNIYASSLNSMLPTVRTVGPTTLDRPK